ncbi:hypothetical protein FRC12_019585 [Ceratobasidium sp. 428]|nr:hypothetical protein FRC12_019585 [Ceratobasidium sp. 428]
MELSCHVLSHWKARRSTLTSAIREYLSACANLHTICTQTQYGTQARQEVEGILQAVDAELEGLKHEEEELRKARSSLAANRNSSKLLSPAHGPPPEVLARIFIELKNQYSSYDCQGVLPYSDECWKVPPYTLSLTGVCSYWRQIAIKTPTLWTQVNLMTHSTSYEYPNLLLERSKGLPVNLHIFHETSDSIITPHWAFLWSTFIQAAGSQIRTLEITCGNMSSIEPISSLLKDWLNLGALRTTNRLCLSALSDDYQVEQNLKLQSTGVHSDSLLRDLTTLHLTRVVIPWNNPAYHGLADLRLCFENDIKIKDYELVGILAASPNLVTLQLYGLNAKRSADWDHIPICPSNLETLCVGTSSVGSASTLLSTISLSGCSNDLSVGLHLPNPLKLTDQLENFFRDKRITTLSCSEFYGPENGFQWALSLSVVIPSLQNLLLPITENEADCDWDEFPMVKPQGSINGSIASTGGSLRHLPHLFIAQCPARLDILKSIVSAYSIQTLHISTRTGWFGRSTDKPNTDELQEMRVALLKEFPELECIVSSKDETESWPCRVDALWYQQVL